MTSSQQLVFGNMRGYPNPGLPERLGLFGDADGGVVFLDEIGDLPSSAQAHLLRFLDRGGEYHRLGESVARRADVRLVAATNRPLTSLREDLLQRFWLRVATPALAERREDVPPLLRHLAAQAARQSPALVTRFRDARGQVRFDAPLVEHALRRALPGGVRELETLLWVSIETSEGDRLALTQAVRRMELDSGAVIEPEIALEPSDDDIRVSLGKHAGNLTRAAGALGLPSRFALYRLLKRRGLALDGLRS